MKKLSTLIGLIVAAGLFFSISIAAAQEETADQKFIKKALMGNLFEIQAGTMAAQKAASPEVKNFGRMMVEDHTKAQDALKPLAQAGNVPVPTGLKEKHQKKVDGLGKKSGDEFDKAYLECMIDDHKKDIERYKKAADKADDPQVKAYAQKILPVLEQHLAKAKDMQGSMEKTMKTK